MFVDEAIVTASPVAVPVAVQQLQPARATPREEKETRVDTAWKYGAVQVLKRGGVHKQGVVEGAGKKWPSNCGSVRQLPLLPRVGLIHSTRSKTRTLETCPVERSKIMMI